MCVCVWSSVQRLDIHGSMSRTRTQRLGGGCLSGRASLVCKAVDETSFGISFRWQWPSRCKLIAAVCWYIESHKSWVLLAPGPNVRHAVLFPGLCCAHRAAWGVEQARSKSKAKAAGFEAVELHRIRSRWCFGAFVGYNTRHSTPKYRCIFLLHSLPGIYGEPSDVYSG